MIAYVVAGLALALLVAGALWRHELDKRRRADQRAARMQRDTAHARAQLADAMRERDHLAAIVRRRDEARAEIQSHRDELAREAARAAAGIDRAANATSDTAAADALNAAEGL